MELSVALPTIDKDSGWVDVGHRGGDWWSVLSRKIRGFSLNEYGGYLGMSPFPEIVAHEGLVRDPRAKKRKKSWESLLLGRGPTQSILSISNYHMVSCRIVVVYDFQQSREW